jgi:hypothetical protein
MTVSKEINSFRLFSEFLNPQNNNLNVSWPIVITAVLNDTLSLYITE